MDGKTVRAGIGGVVAGVALAASMRPGLAMPGWLLTGVPTGGVARQTGTAPGAPEAAAPGRQAQPVPRFHAVLGRSGPPAPGLPGGGVERQTISGTVVGATRAPLGELDGLVLDGGVVVKFPPHVGLAIEGMVSEGQAIGATGFEHVTPHGERHFIALELTLPNGEEIALHALGAPLPPPGYPG